MDFIWTYQI